MTGPVDAAIAARNRKHIESKHGVIALPHGEIVFDRAPRLRSGTTLQGAGQSKTVLKQLFTSSPFLDNCTLCGLGSGMGHVHVLKHGRTDRTQPKVDEAAGWITVDSGVAEKCPPGTLVYTFQYDGYRIPREQNPGGQRNQRRLVVERNGHTLRLDSAIDAKADRIKWFTDAAPIVDIDEGAAIVQLVRNIESLSVGCWVLTTSGASIANEATGELRRVTGISGDRVTLDRPLRRSYRGAALARVDVCSDVTLRDLTIELPINKASESLFATLAVHWRVERCTIRKMAVGNCADWKMMDCNLGLVQAAAASHDLQFRGCRIESITFEEGCADNLIADCRIGPVPANTNCISLRAQADRLTVRQSRLLGGDSPSAQIYFDGPSRECVLEGVTMTGRTPTWIAGDRMRISGVNSDGDIHVQSGSRISISQVRSARLVLGSPGQHSDGVAVDAGRAEVKHGQWKRR